MQERAEANFLMLSYRDLYNVFDFIYTGLLPFVCLAFRSIHTLESIHKAIRVCDKEIVVRTETKENLVTIEVFINEERIASIDLLSEDKGWKMLEEGNLLCASKWICGPLAFLPVYAACYITSKIVESLNVV